MCSFCYNNSPGGISLLEFMKSPSGKSYSGDGLKTYAEVFGDFFGDYEVANFDFWAFRMIFFRGR